MQFLATGAFYKQNFRSFLMLRFRVCSEFRLQTIVMLNLQVLYVLASSVNTTAVRHRLSYHPYCLSLYTIQISYDLLRTERHA